MLNIQMGASAIHRLIVTLAVCAIPAVPCGCNANRPVRANIQSPDAAQRIRAIKNAADSGDVAAIPLIVDRLEDEDQAVQFFAILALERLTGKRLGYEVGQSSSERVAAIDRWRAYVDQGRSKRSINREEPIHAGESLSQRSATSGAQASPAGGAGN